MDQEKPSTPEKQLLDLIEDPKEQDLSQKKIKRSSSSLFSLAALRGRFSFLLESILSGSFFKKNLFDIKGLNRILRICIAVLLIYVIGNFTMSAMRLKDIPDFTTINSRTSGEVPVAQIEKIRISDYLEGPRSRNLFRFGDSPLVEKEEKEDKLKEVVPPDETILSKAETLAQNLDLVGIGWSDNPDAMIRNLDSQKMYFLKRGQRIEGLIKVEAIFEDRVVLTYEGKEVELR